MAFAQITFENPRTGQIRVAPVGFSWTTLFFGPFPALFRSDWIGAAIIILAAMITFGFSNFVFCFIYNKMYVKRLIADGFKVTHSTMPVEEVERRISQRLTPAIAASDL